MTQEDSQNKRSVSVFGVTGSIGQAAVDVLCAHKDRFFVDTVTGNRNITALAKAAVALGARSAITADPLLYGPLRELLSGTSVACGAGPDALLEAASHPIDLLLAAIVGAAGIRPTWEAIKRGTTVALANKECLVCAGDLIMPKARPNQILPVDSEHSAIFQCLSNPHRPALTHLTLTASGGPFRGRTRTSLSAITVEDALNHPNWSMGPKITIDSATLMNKALELIEASYLFGIDGEHIEVVVHPQSIIHSLVTYHDGSTLAQMGMPDMRTPIAYALGFPQRLKTSVPLLDLLKTGPLTFENLDQKTFPALTLGRWALARKGTALPIFNGANEVAVDAFLKQRISFLSIAEVVERTLERAERDGNLTDVKTLEDVLAADALSRQMADEEVARS